jgi:hypothetical protein
MRSVSVVVAIVGVLALVACGGGKRATRNAPAGPASSRLQVLAATDLPGRLRPGRVRVVHAVAPVLASLDPTLRAVSFATALRGARVASAAVETLRRRSDGALAGYSVAVRVRSSAAAVAAAQSLEQVLIAPCVGTCLATMRRFDVPGVAAALGADRVAAAGRARPAHVFYVVVPVATNVFVEAFSTPPQTADTEVATATAGLFRRLTR